MQVRSFLCEDFKPCLKVSRRETGMLDVENVINCQNLEIIGFIRSFLLLFTRSFRFFFPTSGVCLLPYLFLELTDSKETAIKTAEKQGFCERSSLL